MRYAIGFPIAGPLGGDPRSVAELAAIAEQAGWDAVLLEDYLVHHIAPGRIAVSDPWIALAAAAVKTTRIKLGLTVGRAATPASLESRARSGLAGLSLRWPDDSGSRHRRHQ